MNNKLKTILKPKNYIRFVIGIIPILIMAISISCEEEPNALGSELLPDEDKIGYYYDTTFTFSSTVFDKDAIRSNAFNQYPIGTTSNDYLGIFSASLASQFFPETLTDSIHIDEINSIDSIILFLDIDTIFGPSENNLLFKVYELTDSIVDSLAHIYYSDEDINNYFTGSAINTGSEIVGDTLIKLPLTLDFANKFISNGDSINSSYDYFKSIFKGIAITPDTYAANGQVCITNINAFYSKIVLYYNDTLSLNYRFNNGAKFGNFKYSKTSEDFSTEFNDSLMFYESPVGVSSRIKLLNYKDIFHTDTSYSILNAELFVPVYKDEDFDVFPHPNNLSLYYSQEDSILTQVADYNSNNASRYGKYNETLKHYSFNITNHFQDMIDGNILDSCLNLNMQTSYYYPYRVILKSNDNIKLKVTYTKH